MNDLKVCFTLLFVASVSVLLAQPVITSFSPQSGPVGTKVTITGSNFSTTPAANSVSFGAIKVIVASSTATSLLIYVPQGVTYEPISVTVNGFTAYSKNPFIITQPAPLTLSATSFGTHVDFTATAPTTFLSIADVNNDGVADISATLNSATFQNLAYRKNTTDCKNFLFASEFDFLSDGTIAGGLAVADFDGDGRLDPAVSTSASKLVTIFPTNPGNFGNHTNLGVLTLPPGDLKIADMDGDGKPDIVVALFNSLAPASAVAIYRNTSTGIGNFAFSAPQVVNFAANPKNVALSDIDGDGKPDIITSDGITSIRIRRNNSVSGTLNNASFDAEVIFTTATTPKDVSAGDIDGDGKTDLIIACASAISILRNTATSGVISALSLAAKVDIIATTSGAVDLGDLNGDGKVDIAVSNGSTVSVFQNQATAGSITVSSLGSGINFSIGTASVNDVELADENDDGYLDIVVTQSGSFVSVFPYTPPITLPPVITTITANAVLINSSLTINGNNFGTSIATNQVYVGAVKASITSANATKLVVTVPPYATYGPITVENLTSNLSGSSSSNFIPLFDNNKDFGGRIIPAAMGKKIDIDLGTVDATAVSLGDIDGDGLVDMLVSLGSNDTLIILRNKGIKTLGAAGYEKTSLHFDTDGNHMAFAKDMDNDGKLDLVMMVRGVGDQDAVFIYHNESTPGSLSPASFGPVYQVHLPFLSINNSDLIIADMDGDGKLELICENSGKISVFKNNSLPGGFCFAPSVDITAGAQGLSVGDIDGDGKPDLAVAGGYYGTGGFKLIRNTSIAGSLSFGTPVLFSPAGTGNIVNVNIVDMDGDTKPDIAWVGFLASGGNGLHIMKNISTSGTLDASSLANEVTYFWTNGAISPYSYSAIGDLNGDGKPDIVGTGSVSGGTQTIGAFQNVSQTGVIDATSFLEGVSFEGAVNYGEQYPTIGDLDGDGKPEIIVTNGSYVTHILSIYHNETYPAPQIDVVKNNSGVTQDGAIGSDIFTQGNYQFTNNDTPVIRFGAAAGTVANATNTIVTTKVPSGASQDRVSVTLHGLTGFTSAAFIPTFATTGTLDATTFSTKVDYSLTVGPTAAIAVSDFDNDGKPDIAAGDGGDISILRSSLAAAGNTITTTTFTLLPKITASIGGDAIAVGDFDGDGLPDLQGFYRIFHNTSGSQAQPISFETGIGGMVGAFPNTGRAKTNIDFNHDGKTDIVSASTSGTVFVSENFSRKGAFNASPPFSTFNTAVNLNASGTLGETGAADFDGDGYDDIVFLNTSGSQLQYMLNTKLNRSITIAQFASAQSIATATSPAYLVVRDFDQDGKPDVVVGHSTVATISIFRNTSTPGNISFARQDFSSLVNTNQLDAADLDGDGKPEIVSIHGINAGPFNFSILKNTSTTGISFGSKIDYTLPTQPMGIVLADVNQDAKTDILIARNQFLSIFQNQLPSGSIINITSQPATTSTCENGTASLTITATGTNLTYQWLKFNTSSSTFDAVGNNSFYSGATTSTLSIHALDNSVEGNYKCRVSGDNASDVFSNPVSVTLSAQSVPTITATGLTLQASAGAAYQWYSFGNIIDGATTSTLEISALNYGVYAVDVTGGGCTARSADFIYLVTGNEPTLTEVKLYPNPVHDKLIIETIDHDLEVELIDIVGLTLKRPEEKTENHRILNMSDLPTGAYIIHIKLNEKHAYKHIIKN